MLEFGVSYEDSIVIGGDFNCPLNPLLDKKGGILIPRTAVIQAINSLQEVFSLQDIWRIKNPEVKSFTWSQKLPFVFCRLDYWIDFKLFWYENMKENITLSLKEIIIGFCGKDLESRAGVVVRALVFHQCVPGSILPLGVISGLSLLVLYSASRGFSPGTPVFPSPQKPTFDLI